MTGIAHLIAGISMSNKDDETKTPVIPQAGPWCADENAALSMSGGDRGIAH